MNKSWLHAGIVVIYLLVTLGMTWPVLLHINNAVAGVGGDPWQTMWRFQEKQQYFQDSITTGNVRSFFKEEFLGGGEPRLVNLSVWPWMPVYGLFGMPAAYNIIWLLSFVLSGYAMYLLVSVWTNKESSQSLWLKQAPAFLAGLFYMFVPYHAAHAQGHFGAMQMQWIPFIFLTGISLHRKFSWPKLVLLWLLITIQAWSEHHYMIWLVLFIVMAALFAGKRLKPYLFSGEWIKRGAVLMGLLVISVVLPYFPTLKLQSTGDAIELGQEQTIRFSADLFSYVVPASFHPLWGGLFYNLFGKYFTGNIAENTQFLGWVPLLLILFFRRSIPWQHRKFWVIVGFVFMVIALGPRLHIFGKVLPIPLPYALIDSWPIFSAIRAVARAGAFISLSVAILFFWVLKANIHRVGSAVIVALVIVIEFLFAPVQMQSAVLPPIYSQLDPATGKAIIEIPAATNYTAASRALFASLSHGKKVVGNIALERAEAPADLDVIKAVPAVRQLLYLKTTDLRQDRSEFFAQSLPESLPDAMAFLDIGEIIIHTDSLSVLEVATIRGFLEEDVGLIPKEFSDALLYTKPNVWPKQHDGVFLMRDTRWQAVGFDPVRNHVFGEVNPQAAVTLVNVRPTPLGMKLTLRVAKESPDSLRIFVGSKVIGEIKPGGVGSFPVAAMPGKTVVDFESSHGGKAIVQDPQLLIN